jgi:hypothetical protein
MASAPPIQLAVVDPDAPPLPVPEFDAAIKQVEEYANNRLYMIVSLNEGECKIKRDQKADENKSVAGSPLAATIRETTQAILAETDCDALQLKVKTAINGVKDDLKDKLGLTKEKLAEINPLLSIPLNPLKLPGYVKKQTVGRVLPDLDATIDLIIKTVEVINAIIELIQVVEKVIPNLKACAVDLKKDLKQQLDDEIDQIVEDVKSEIAKTIAEAICQGVNALGITANDIEGVLSAVRAVEGLTDDLKFLLQSSQSSLSDNISTVGSNQATLQELTGVAPVLDTTSVDSFLATAQSPEYQQYKESVKAVLNIPEPVSNTAPAVTGNAVVGSVLTCSNGTWEANGATLTYSHQWYRNGLEIQAANTFTYTPTIDDIELNLYCMVTAQTNVTVEEARSNVVGPITFELNSEDKPTLSGTAAPGNLLTCTTGTWPFTPTMILYEWIRGTSTVVRSLSGNNTYNVTSSDIGSTIKCKVVAQAFRYTLSDTTAATSTII